ncbi:hypothetical protein Tco_0306349, partial [Tanacetum coccineum]
MGFLKCFEKASGLKLKLSKSSLYGVGVPQQEVNAMASFLRCRSCSLPFVYLGLSVSFNMNRVESWNPIFPFTKKSWNPIVEKFKEKLSFLESENVILELGKVMQQK